MFFLCNILHKKINCKIHKIEFSDRTLQRTFNDLIIFSLLVAFSDIQCIFEATKLSMTFRQSFKEEYKFFIAYT